MIAIADTSVLIAQDTGRPLDWASMPERLRVSIITIGELRSGLLSAQDESTRIRRLDTYQRALTLEPVPLGQDVAERWAELRLALQRRDPPRKMPVNDSWIAATALHLAIPVVTQDDDYDGCPGLDVIGV